MKRGSALLSLSFVVIVQVPGQQDTTLQPALQQWVPLFNCSGTVKVDIVEGDLTMQITLSESSTMEVVRKNTWLRGWLFRGSSNGRFAIS